MSLSIEGLSPEVNQVLDLGNKVEFQTEVLVGALKFIAGKVPGLASFNYVFESLGQNAVDSAFARSDFSQLAATLEEHIEDPADLVRVKEALQDFVEAHGESEDFSVRTQAQFYKGLHQALSA